MLINLTVSSDGVWSIIVGSVKEEGDCDERGWEPNPVKVITNTWVVIINTEHRLTLKVTTAQVVETPVTANNSLIHGTGPDHQSYSNYLWTVHHLVRCHFMACILCLAFSMLIIRWGYQLKPETQREQQNLPLNYSQYNVRGPKAYAWKTWWHILLVWYNSKLESFILYCHT